MTGVGCPATRVRLRREAAQSHALKYRLGIEWARRVWRPGARIAFLACGVVAISLLVASGSWPVQPGESRRQARATCGERGSRRRCRGSVHESESVRSKSLTATFSTTTRRGGEQKNDHWAGVGEARVSSSPGWLTSREPARSRRVFGFPPASHQQFADIGSAFRQRAAHTPRSLPASASRRRSSELMPQGSLTVTGQRSLNREAVTAIRGTIKGTTTSAGHGHGVPLSLEPPRSRCVCDYRDSRGDTATISFSNWASDSRSNRRRARSQSRASRKRKADAAARSSRTTAQVAAETYATDHAGSYAGLTPTVVHSYHLVDPDRPGNGNAYMSHVSGTPTGYTVNRNSDKAATPTASPARRSGIITRTVYPGLRRPRRLHQRHLVTARGLGRAAFREAQHPGRAAGITRDSTRGHRLSVNDAALLRRCDFDPPLRRVGGGCGWWVLRLSDGGALRFDRRSRTVERGSRRFSTRSVAAR